MKTAFYDLSAAPYSHDSGTFAMLAVLEGCDRMVVVPGCRSQDVSRYTEAERTRRIETMIVPFARCLGLDVVVAKNRDDAMRFYEKDCFPVGYHIHQNPNSNHQWRTLLSRMPADLSLRPSAASVEAMRPYAGAVVISFREQKHIQPKRNSLVGEWLKAAAEMTKMGYRVVIIPDTGKPAPVAGFEYCVEAAMDEEKRIALMQGALVNMGSMSGNFGWGFSINVPMVLFVRIQPESANNNASTWKKFGIPEKTQPHWFKDNQRLFWGMDNAQNILAEFQRWISLNHRMAA